MPAAYKLRRIEDYKSLKNELHKVKALKTLLNDVAWHDNTLKGKIQNSLTQFQNIVDELDQDPVMFGRPQQVKNSPIIQRFEKTSGALNEMIACLFAQSYGIEGIDYENIEEVYNPLRSGFGSLHKTHEFLMSKGIKAETSKMLCRRYLNKLASEDFH